MKWTCYRHHYIVEEQYLMKNNSSGYSEADVSENEEEMRPAVLEKWNIFWSNAFGFLGNVKEIFPWY